MVTNRKLLLYFILTFVNFFYSCRENFFNSFEEIAFIKVFESGQYICKSFFFICEKNVLIKVS